jgi:hypothetical protein
MLEEHQRERVEMGRDLIEEGIRKRILRGVHSRLVAEAMLAAVQRVMESEFLAEAGLSVSDAVEEVEDFLLHGLLNPRRRAGKTGKKIS